MTGGGMERHTDRVLDVFEPGLWMRAPEIRAEARMDTSSCLYALKALVEQGVIEQAVLKRPNPRQGRHAHIYRLAMRRTA